MCIRVVLCRWTPSACTGCVDFFGFETGPAGHTIYRVEGDLPSCGWVGDIVLPVELSLTQSNFPAMCLPLILTVSGRRPSPDDLPHPWGGRRDRSGRSFSNENDKRSDRGTRKRSQTLFAAQLDSDQLSAPQTNFTTSRDTYRCHISYCGSAQGS